jgi:hypothetical protein
MRRWLLVIISSLFLLAVSRIMAQDFEYAVRHGHTFKDCRGILKISPEGVEYKTDHTKDNRRWKFDDIRVIELESPAEISIVTYEDQKLWMGKDKVFTFTLLNKKATPELTEFLLGHVKRPKELAVIPEESEEPVYEIPVKHLRTISGTMGTLRIYPHKVVYQSAVPRDSRCWRIRDIARFSQPERFRFQIVSYLSKAGGPNESYNFQLLQDLPEGVYDYLWVRLHPSSYYPDVGR